jgi:hypothetical protein
MIKISIAYKVPRNVIMSTKPPPILEDLPIIEDHPILENPFWQKAWKTY